PSRSRRLRFCSRSFSFCPRHQFVVQVISDFRSGDAHAPTSPSPSPPAKPDRFRARLTGLAEDDHPLDAHENWKAGDGSGRAERPCRWNAGFARGHAGLDPRADGEFVADRVEHHCRAMNDAEHAAVNLRAVAIECNPVDCRDRAVVNAAERRDQCGHAISLAGVLISPRACRMKAPNAASEIGVKIELAVDVEISLSERSSRVAPRIPDGNRALNSQMVIFASRPLHRFTAGCGLIEPRLLRHVNAAVLPISRLPLGKAETFAHIVFASEWIIARKRVDDKALRCARYYADRERTVASAMARTRRQDLLAYNLATEGASDCANVEHRRCLKRVARRRTRRRGFSSAARCRSFSEIL